MDISPINSIQSLVDNPFLNSSNSNTNVDMPKEKKRFFYL